MKVLITGGAGFIGSHMAAYLLEQGHEVTIIDNYITGDKRNIAPLMHHERFHSIEADIVSEDLSDHPSYDGIFHLASPASPVQYMKYPIETLRTNANGTDNLLQYLTKHPSCRFLLASTSEVYGDPLEHPQKETYWGNVNPNGIRSCYDEAKRYAEAISFSFMRSYDLDIRIARIFNTYGPQMEIDDGRVVSNFVTQALTKQPITVYGSGDQTRSLCYVSDMVEALFRLATYDNLKGSVINVGNPTEMTVQEIAEKVKEATQSPSEIIHEPIDADDPKRRRPDISKAQEILQWQPSIPFDQGLTKTIAYFQSVI